MSKKILILKFIIFLFAGFSSDSYADKIRDLTSIQGIRDNQLIGYGLIVGLNGTGDQSIQTGFTNQSLSNMLSKLGISIPKNSNMHLKNVASVVVTAKLPPFGHIGEQIDVIVSSIGNSKSLKGGTLLMTPLKGNDNQIYAIAQGNILVSEKDNSERRINYFSEDLINSGRINQGATIEREVNTNFGKKNIINLQLNHEDFSTAQRISDMINLKYPDTATPINPKTVQISTSANNNIQVHMIANIQNINVVMPDEEAKVVINPSTGSVVINKAVKLDECAISNSKLSIIVHQTNNLYYKNLMNQKYQNQKDTVDKQYIEESYLNRINLNNIVRALNILGEKTNELVSILQSMKKAGCLHAKLEII